ncbi:MAG: type II toxin-antitoxin system VapC family toxin [Acidobacteriota bacterium]
MANPLNLLLDTHVLLWWIGASNHLSEKGLRAIVEAGRIYVSAASVWEASIKAARGKLTLHGDLTAQIEAHRFTPLAVTFAHAVAAGYLPLHHTDPFDRMLIAQARAESLVLVTADKQLRKYDVPTILV